MATVIDQFIVKYTLDTKDLDKGISATEKKLEGLKRESKDAGMGMGDAINAGATRATKSLSMLSSILGKGGLIGVAVGSLVYAAKTVDDKMFTVARSLRRLGIDSKNFGIAANEMRNLQYASEMAGGSMEDATQTVGDLSKSLFNLKFNGQVSESLVMLSRLGVQFQDSYGRARDFKDVMLDTASALDRAKASGRMSEAEGYQFALQAGFVGGEANLVNSGRTNVDKELAIQAARRQVQGGDIAAGTRWERASISLGQAVEAGVGNAGIGKFGNARAAATEDIEKVGDRVKSALSNFGDAVTKATKPLLDFLMTPGAGGRGGSAGRPTKSSSSRTLREFFMSPGKGGRAGMGRTNTTSSSVSRGIRNNNPLNMMARMSKGQYIDAHDDGGFRIFKSMDEGLMEANRQLEIYAKRGNNTLGGIISTWAPNKDKNGKVINDTKGYIDDVAKRTGIGSNQVVGPEQRAAVIAAMARHDSGYIVPNESQIKGSPTANVNISSMTINTQATDAKGIAASIGDELSKRKLLAAQAERGGQ